MIRRILTLLLISIILPVWADIANVPPEIPKLDRRLQVNSSNVIMSDTICARWSLSDGNWWCLCDKKEKVRQAFIQRLDDLLSPYGSGATSWRDVDTVFALGGNPLNGFERAWCFSWLPK